MHFCICVLWPKLSLRKHYNCEKQTCERKPSLLRALPGNSLRSSAIGKKEHQCSEMKMSLGTCVPQKLWVNQNVFVHIFPLICMIISQMTYLHCKFILHWQCPYIFLFQVFLTAFVHVVIDLQNISTPNDLTNLYDSVCPDFAATLAAPSLETLLECCTFLSPPQLLRNR